MMKAELIFLILASTIGGSVGVTISEVRYGNGEWVGFISCDLVGINGDCDLSVHQLGKRIDLNHHDANQEVSQSCYQGQNSVGLTIHNFTYGEVQHYTCLSSGPSTWETHSSWLWTYPVIEANIPATSQVGDTVSLSCSSYASTPLYWVMPGVAANRTAYGIESSDDGINSTSTLTFQLIDSDGYGEFWYCASMKPSQQTVSPCSFTVITIQNPIRIGSTEDYTLDNGNSSITCEFQGYPDPTNIKWKKCAAVTPNICFGIASEEQSNELDHVVTSKAFVEYSEDYLYICSAENSFGTANKTFQPKLGNYSPRVTSGDKIFYVSSSGFNFRMSCTVKANPIPEIYWNMQNFWNSSAGSVVFYAGQSGRYQVVNTLIGVDTYDTTLFISDYDADTDLATYACSAINDYGFGAVEMEAEIGPDDVGMEVCGGSNHAVGELVQTILSYSGFPPPSFDVTVVADDDIDYWIVEQYDGTTGVKLVTVNFYADANNPHVQINGSAFFPYVLFTNENFEDVYVSSSVERRKASKLAAAQSYCP